MNFSLDTEKIKDFVKSQTNSKNNSGSSNASFISESGVYPIKIHYVGINQYSKGSKSFYIAYSLNDDSNESLIYGGVFEKDDGSVCSFGFNQIQIMQFVFGLKDLSVAKKRVKLYNGEEKDIDVFKELQNKKCLVQVTLEYSKYNNKISRRILFRDMFREDDKANGVEIANKKNYGNKWKWIQDNKDKISQPSYRDVTPDEVKKWFDSKKQKTEQVEDDLFNDNNSELPF